MKKLAISIGFVVALVTPTAALAYIGPGAGVSLLGAFWALLAAVGTTLLFIVAWPIRRILRRRGKTGSQLNRNTSTEALTPESVHKTHQ